MKRKQENDSNPSAPKKPRTYEELTYAPQDDAAVLFELGFCYEKGLGVTRNLQSAFAYYTKAAQFKSSEAAYKLGQWYEAGYFVKTDLKTAFHFYSVAAADNHGDSLGKLGKFYLLGMGVDKNPEMTFKYFNLAAPYGQLEVIFRRGFCYMDGIGVKPDMQMALKDFEQASNLGFEAASHMLGVCYRQGKGVAPDAQMAFKYFSIGAEKDFTPSQVMLGICYLKGQGVQENTSLAVALFDKAAKKMHAHGLYYLGKCYLNGTGVQKNKPLAFDYFKQAASKDYHKAITRLGICYQNGIGVLKDPQQAFKYFEQAAEKKYIKGIYLLGLCYEQGLGIKKDLGLAFENYAKVAPKYALAMYKLGVCYSKGQGVAENLEEAFGCYTKAVQLKPDFKEAMYELGLCYLYGKGVKSSLEEALPLLDSVFEKGILDAMFQLGMWHESKVPSSTNSNQKSLAFECYVKLARKKYTDKFTTEFMGERLDDLLCEVGILFLKERNECLTVKLLELAAGMGNPEAQFRLGDFYSGMVFSESLNFCSMDVNILKAFENYEKSASQGHSIAKNRLEDMEVHYRKGFFYEMVQQDLVKAYVQYNWIIKQQKTGAIFGRTRVSMERVYGKIKENPELLNQLNREDLYPNLPLNELMLIADGGDKDAQYSLALFFEKQASNQNKSSPITFFAGLKGSDISDLYLEKAVRFFKQAASQGHEKAKLALEEYSTNVSGGSYGRSY